MLFSSPSFTALTKWSYTDIYIWYQCRSSGTYSASTSTTLKPGIGTDTSMGYGFIANWMFCLFFYASCWFLPWRRRIWPTEAGCDLWTDRSCRKRCHYKDSRRGALKRGKRKRKRERKKTGVNVLWEIRSRLDQNEIQSGGRHKSSPSLGTRCSISLSGLWSFCGKPDTWRSCSLTWSSRERPPDQTNKKCNV